MLVFNLTILSLRLVIQAHCNNTLPDLANVELKQSLQVLSRLEIETIMPCFTISFALAVHILGEWINKHMWLYFGKPTIYAQELKSIFCLYVIDTLMHYPETPNTRQKIVRSALTYSFLPMLLNHEDAFHGPGGNNRTAWGTKLLLAAVWASPENCISLCHKLKAQHCSLSPNECFNPPLAPHPPIICTVYSSKPYIGNFSRYKIFKDGPLLQINFLGWLPSCYWW